MTYTELSPSELLRSGFAAPRITEEQWLVRWDRFEGDVEALVPATVDLGTSGSTGASRTWRRTREQMWAEAGLLAGLLEKDRPEAVLSFAPPKHVYGALAGVLVPALLRLPVWYRPRYFGALPSEPFDRWAVVAVPWTFSILLRALPWVSAAERLVVLHSTALLPATAGELVSAAGAEQVGIVEVFGSTEAGGIASRTWSPSEQPWRLFDDVDFAPAPGARSSAATGTPASGEPSTGPETASVMPEDIGGVEIALAVTSPRLAFAPGGVRPSIWVTDDLIVPLDDRSFRFAGRSSRLVKVNGRRVNLDHLEESLRQELRCADLAFLPIADAVSGEHLDLLVVPEAGHPLTDADVRAALARIGALPRNVSVVDRIDRSATGKLRRFQPPPTADAGAAT
ncbi:hypothetical protein [Nonomuraea sp. 10N515B]|uniref:hypothetical protein n=1 Tax=Nonomuraea sp. 10N515B TaxID=3457422 RepID=UPI003FCDC710